MGDIQKLLDEIYLTMRDKKLTKTSVCEEVGISWRTLDKILNGKGKVEDLIKVLEFVRGL